MGHRKQALAHMSPVGQCADRPALVTDLKRHLANQHIVGKHVGFLKPVDKGSEGLHYFERLSS